VYSFPIVSSRVERVHLAQGDLAKLKSTSVALDAVLVNREAFLMTPAGSRTLWIVLHPGTRAFATVDSLPPGNDDSNVQPRASAMRHASASDSLETEMKKSIGELSDG